MVIKVDLTSWSSMKIDTVTGAKNWKRFLFIGVLFITSSLFAQVDSPPSLSLGVAGVVGERGSIDVDVLAEIISAKQAELKKEFIKKTIFKDLENHGYVTWLYVHNSLDVLLESESKEAIKKNLLENSANLALVYGFAELYLQIAHQMTHSDLDNVLRQFDNEYDHRFGIGKNMEEKSPLLLASLKKYHHEIDKDNLNFSTFFIDMVFDVLMSSDQITDELGFLGNSFPLGREYYKQHSAYHRLKNTAAFKTPIESLRSRMNREVKVLLDNFILIKRLKGSNVNLNELIETYKSSLTKIGKDYGMSFIKIDSLQQIVDEYYDVFLTVKSLGKKISNKEKIGKDISLLQDNLQLAFDKLIAENKGKDSIGNKKQKKLNDSQTKLEKIKKDFNSLTSEIDSLKKRLIAANNSLQDIKSKMGNAKEDLLKARVLFKDSLFNILSSQTDNVFRDIQGVYSTKIHNGVMHGATIVSNSPACEDCEQLTNELSANMAAFSRFRGKEANFGQNDLYFLENSINPMLVKLTARGDFNPNYLKVAAEFDKLISWDLLMSLEDKLLNSDMYQLSKANLSTFSELLEFFTKLDQLDKVETYQFVLKTIQSTGEIFEEKKLGYYITILTENLDKYTLINTEENIVEVKVEDIINRVYDKYGNRQSGIFSLYFSVGVNQSINSNYTFTTSTLFPDSSGFIADSTATLNSLAFVSEKIGVKLKLLDFKKRNTYNIGEEIDCMDWGLFSWGQTVKKYRSKSPLISDVYFVAYGSGLLYNITNLATEEEFNEPLIGGGIGIAFSNSLDFNITYNKALNSDNEFFDNLEEQRIWAISFDVKITEYLAAIGKKRKSKTE